MPRPLLLVACRAGCLFRPGVDAARRRQSPPVHVSCLPGFELRAQSEETCLRLESASASGPNKSANRRCLAVRRTKASWRAQVQRQIASRAKLTIAPWDGYLKYYNLGTKVRIHSEGPRAKRQGSGCRRRGRGAHESICSMSDDPMLQCTAIWVKATRRVREQFSILPCSKRVACELP